VEDWPQIIGGDGGFLAYDFSEPFRRYTTYVYLTVFRFVNEDWTEITGPWGGDPAGFISPLVMDPNNSHALLGGTNRIWRTANAHGSAVWSAISTSAVSGGGLINAIAVAPGNSNVIYSGSSTAKVHVTTDGGSNWFDRSPALILGEISDVVIDPSDPGRAYVSYYNTSGGRVMRTSNYGVNWNNVTGNMPVGVSSRALAVDWRFEPPMLYSGSGVGVYTSVDGGAHWVKDGLDLPNVIIGDLGIDTTNNTITAGTYGRGAWRADLPGVPMPGDLDGDGEIGLGDYAVLFDCMNGPDVSLVPVGCTSAQFQAADEMGDNDVDVEDYRAWSERVQP